MVTRSHAVAGRNVQKTIPQDRNFFMRHAIMRSCKHARRAPSADAAAQSQHAGHVSALGEAQLVVERPGALVLDVHVELYLLGLGLGSDHRMRSGVCDRDGAHLADRAERAEPGVPGHPEQRGRSPAPPEGGIDVQLAHKDDPLRLRRVRVRVSVSEDRARLRLESAHLAVQAEADELVPARSADEVVVRAREQLAERLIVASVAAHRALLERDTQVSR